MREITKIIIHCADTPASMDIGVEEICPWHLERHFSDVGYHHIIRRDGIDDRGRPHEQTGAHVAAHNANSIGVCMVGGKGKNNAAFGRLFHARKAFQWISL